MSENSTVERKLSTIQKRENLNKIFSTDQEGPGGAHHSYKIVDNCDDEKVYAYILLQNGPRKEENSIHGVIDGDLLEIVRDRLKSFQAGPYSSKENEQALNHIEEALMWLNRRVEDRLERNVLGKYEK
jgi:hypothetical protein